MKELLIFRVWIPRWFSDPNDPSILSACCLPMVSHSSSLDYMYIMVSQEQGQCATDAELSGFLIIREDLF